jgi:hypothetical protein
MWTAWQDASQNEIFLGHAGEIDVYYEDHNYDAESSVPEPYIYLVCPPSRILIGEDGYNFDGYRIVEHRLERENSRHDVHVELDEMCEVMRLVVEHGYIKLEVKND